MCNFFLSNLKCLEGCMHCMKCLLALQHQHTEIKKKTEGGEKISALTNVKFTACCRGNTRAGTFPPLYRLDTMELQRTNEAVCALFPTPLLSHHTS